MNSILLSLAFMAIGLTVGFMAQRSRMCLVAGLRDWILVRDTELLMGLLSFLATVWVLSSVLGALGLMHRGIPEYLAGADHALSATTVAPKPAATAPRLNLDSFPSPSALLGNLFLATLGGGFLIGVLSVMVGGCVMRQHVLFAQGDRDALYYLVGFYAAVPVYYTLSERFFGWVYR